MASDPLNKNLVPFKSKGPAACATEPRATSSSLDCAYSPNVLSISVPANWPNLS